MEQNDESQLRNLLKEWRAPATPPSLEQRVLAGHEGLWHFLVRGYIRVPVPVACCLAVLMVAGVWKSARLAEKAESCLAMSRPATAVSAVAIHVQTKTCLLDSKC